MATLEELQIKFTAEVSGLRSGMAGAEASIKRLEKQVDRSSKKMQSTVGGLGRLFKFDLLIRYGRELLTVEDNMEKLASQIRDTADRADIGVEALQRLRHAADQNGTSAEALDSALVRLNKAIGLARSGAEGMDEIFRALGLGELIEKGARTEEVFLGLAEAVMKMKDESQASAIMARIMGREADRLIELMKNGAVDVKKLGDELSRVISEETVNRLDQARDRTEAFKKVVNSFLADVSALAFGIGENLVGAIKEFYAWLEKTTGFMSGAASVWERWARFVGEGVEDLRGLPKGALAGGPTAAPVAGVAPKGGLAAPNVTPNAAAINRLFGGGADNDAVRKAEEATRRYKDTVADLVFEMEQLARSEQEAAFQQELRSALSQAEVTIESERGQAIKELVSQFHSLKIAHEEYLKTVGAMGEAAAAAMRKLQDEMEEYAEKWQEIGDQIEGNIADAFLDIVSNADSASEAVGRLIEQIGMLIAKALILQAIQGITGSVFGDGGIGAALGKAAGGPVAAGTPYMVGERGPELFVPRAAGNIVPNNRMGGSSISVNAPLVVNGGVNNADLMRALAAHRMQIRREIVPIIQDAQKRNVLTRH